MLTCTTFSAHNLFQLTIESRVPPSSNFSTARIWQSNRRLHWLTTRHATARLLSIRDLQDAFAGPVELRGVAGDLCCKTKSCCACSRPREPSDTDILSFLAVCIAAHTCSAHL